MRLSTKSRYAVTAMLELVLNGRQGAVTLADISDKQSISLSYLEQLFAALRGKGLVRGVRGPGGGYYLGREAAQISIADIICAVDEYVEYTRSPSYRKNNDTQAVSTRTLWEDLSEQIFEFLDGMSLADLVARGTTTPDAGVTSEPDRLSAMGLPGRAA